MKHVFTLLAEVHIAHQTARDSISISEHLLILFPLSLTVVEHMKESMQTELARIIIARGNGTVSLAIKVVREEAGVQPVLCDSGRFH